MALIGDYGILKWNSANKKRYEEFGYLFTKWGEEFLVRIEHLTPTTRAKVTYKCDYCDEKVETEFKKYNLNLKRSIVKKDTCEKCVTEKIKESSLEKYGVDSPNKASIVKDKKKESTLEKYGVENISQVQEVKEKVKNTVLNRYGVNNVFKSDKVISQMKITRYENKTITTSKQQLYLNNLLKGELNFPVGKCSIDIAILNEKLAIEYDGGGHELHVKFNEISKEDFRKKEMNREYFLINKGWKILRIVSKRDYLPTDEEILELINRAAAYLNDGHNWVKIDIDNKRLYGSSIDEMIDFKKLRKI